MTAGFCIVLDDGAPPVNVQLHPVGELVPDALKETANGGHPEIGEAVIEATGTWAYPAQTNVRVLRVSNNSFLINTDRDLG